MYSHTIKVVVIQARDVTSSFVLPQSYFVDLPRKFGVVILSPAKITKLWAVHQGYKTALRYTDDEELYYLGTAGVGGTGDRSRGGGADDYEDACEDFVQVLS